MNQVAGLGSAGDSLGHLLDEGSDAGDVRAGVARDIVVGHAIRLQGNNGKIFPHEFACGNSVRCLPV